MRPRFKPCPICGNELDADHNLFYYDSQREWLSNIVNIQNYDDMMDPVNIRDERVWNGLSMIERMCYEAEYEAAIGIVEFLVLKCPCGFSFEADAHAVHFPEYHWLDEMKELANRRWTGDDNEAGSE